MDIPPISQDDVTDVVEMTNKLERSIKRVVKDNQSSLALSALMNATISSILAQCKTVKEVILYRNVFILALDEVISGIYIKNKDQL